MYRDVKMIIIVICYYIMIYQMVNPSTIGNNAKSKTSPFYLSLKFNISIATRIRSNNFGQFINNIIIGH